MSFIYSKVGFADFINAFNVMGRGDQFTHHGLVMLYDYIIEQAEGAYEPIELDVIALCCEYSEYTANEVLKEYSNLFNDYSLDLEGPYLLENIADILSNETHVIGYCVNSDTIVIQSF